MQSKWFIALSPEGAARQAGTETMRAFESILGKDRCKAFDCATYLSAFSSMLKQPDHTVTVDLLNQSLLVQCLAFEATHILVLALSPVTLFTLAILRKQRVKTAHWFYEDFRRAGYWKDVLNGYDHFLAIQKGPLADECARRGIPFAYVPTAAGRACAESAGNAQAPRTIDVAFVGIPSSYRVHVLQTLLASGISLAIAGSGWNSYTGPLSPCIVSGTWTNENQSREILCRARIGLNLSLNSPAADPSNTHLSPRVFDVIASHGVLATEDIPLAGETLRGLRYLAFGDAQDAVAEIKAALGDMVAWQARCEENARAVLRDHTYLNRVKDILALCE